MRLVGFQNKNRACTYDLAVSHVVFSVDEGTLNQETNKWLLSKTVNKKVTVAIGQYAGRLQFKCDCIR